MVLYATPDRFSLLPGPKRVASERRLGFRPERVGIARFAATHDRGPSIKYPPISLNIATAEATADILLTKPPTRRLVALGFCRICRQKREPTSGLEPLTCSLRVCGQWLLRVARVCKYRIGIGFSVPGSATWNRGQAASSASSSHFGFRPRHLGTSAGGTTNVNNSSIDQR